MVAVKNGHYQVVRCSWNLGRMNQVNKNGNTPLMVAAQNGHTAVVGTALLAAEGINVNQDYQNGATPLMAAAQNGHTAVVTALLAAEG